MTPNAELLTLAVRWLPFGRAPADEVFIAFGLTCEQFRGRLADALVHERRRITPATVVALMEAYRL